MDLAPYIRTLRDDLVLAAESAGVEASGLLERLTAPMDSAIRLALLEALTSAAAEITRDLAPGSVEVRLRGRDPEFVVTPALVAAEVTVPDRSPAHLAAWVPAEGDDATMTRINLRLPQDLKDGVEEAARLSGLSVNAWLVRSAATALTGAGPSAPHQRAPRGGDRYSGWVR
jgi:hypothetical protein